MHCDHAVLDGLRRHIGICQNVAFLPEVLSNGFCNLVNLCKGRLETRKRVIPVEGVKEESIEFIGGEDRMDLDYYLGTLKESHREIIRLRYYLDMDYKSISELLEIPLGTVKSRVNTAMDKLRSAMGEENLDDQAR